MQLHQFFFLSLALLFGRVSDPDELCPDPDLTLKKTFSGSDPRKRNGPGFYLIFTYKIHLLLFSFDIKVNYWYINTGSSLWSINTSRKVHFRWISNLKRPTPDADPSSFEKPDLDTIKTRIYFEISFLSKEYYSIKIL